MTTVVRSANGRGARAALQAAVSQPDGSQLAAAVLAVQIAAPKLMPNADGQVGGRVYKYVTLDALMDAVLQLLVDHELLWRTFPTRDMDGAPALRYRMTHIPSGESDEDVMALMLAKEDPQGQGSALTYARRYALVSYLNLTVDPDDDGAAASQHTAPQSDRIKAPQPTAEPPRPSERAATAKQRGMLEAKARAKGLDAGAFANIVLEAADEPVRNWRTEEHASQTLARLLDRLPARLVTQVKDAIG